MTDIDKVKLNIDEKLTQLFIDECNARHIIIHKMGKIIWKNGRISICDWSIEGHYRNNELSFMTDMQTKCNELINAHV